MTPEQQKAYAQKMQARGVGNIGWTGGTTNAQQVTTARATSTIAQKKDDFQFASNPRPSNVQQLANWTVGVGKGIGNIAMGGGKLAGNIAADTGRAVYESVEKFGLHKVITGTLSRDLDHIRDQNKQLDEQIEEWTTLYKSGRISSKSYADMMRQISKDAQDLSERSINVGAQANSREVAEGAAGTLITILSAGKFAPSRVALRGSAGLSTAQVFKGSGMTASVLAGRTGATLTRLEDAAARIPAVRALMARNGAVLTNANRGIVNQSLRDATAMALFKHPFVYHATVEDVGDVMRDIRDNDVGGGTLLKAAFVTTLAFDGGIFGLATTSHKKLKESWKLGALGRGSYWDEVSSRTSNGNPRMWVDWLNNMKETNPSGFKRVERVMRQAQESNLQRFNSAGEAADAVGLHYAANHGTDLSKLSFSQFMKRELKYWDNRLMLDDLAKQGKLLDAEGNIIKPGKLALGTFDRISREQLLEKLGQLSYTDRISYLNTLKNDANVFWAQNEGLFNRVIAAVGKTDNMEDVSKAIQKIDTAFAIKGVPKEVAHQLAKDGYITIAPKQNLLKTFADEDTRKLITRFIDKGDEVFDATVAPKPFLGNFYGTLKKMGMSTEGANDIAYKHLQNAVVGNLDNLNLSQTFGLVGDKDVRGGGAIILSKLQDYANTARLSTPGISSIANRISATNAITDIRQLSPQEIAKALDISPKQAKEVSKAIMDGYKQLPLELRGLGDRAVDNLFRYVPGYKYYNRAQGALRYSYNPFFRTQEITETQILSSIKGNKLNNANFTWGKRRQELNQVVEQLEEARIFSTGFSGEGARNDVILGRLTANMTSYQKRDLAGLADTIAKRKGTTVADMIKNNYDELEDALKVVVQYPSRGVIASPLARTINLAFFPMRYNIKVAGMVAEGISKQPPAMQLAIVKGLFDAGDWLKTDEGLAWQNENYEVLGLLRWITPIDSVSAVLNMLNGRVDSISDLGLLGGLPFGVIPQILDGQGVFQNLPGGVQYNTPYVDPRTGKVFEDRIPESLRAKANYAVIDFFNSTFTFPGRILGLPGKRQFLREIASLGLDAQNNEFRSVPQDDQLTELQKRQVDVIRRIQKGENVDDDDIAELYRSPNGVGFAIPNLEALVGTPTLQKLDSSALPSGKRSGKRAKPAAQPIPGL
jgi:hypothetical protein